MKIFKPNRGKGFVKGSERVGEITATYMSDDFTGNDGDAPDATKWTIIKEIGGDFTSDVEIQNNKADFTISGSTVYPPGLGTSDLISNFWSGNFSVQIDWEILSLIGINNGSVNINLIVENAYYTEPNYKRVMLARQISTRSGLDWYRADLYITDPFESNFDTYSTSELDGRMKISRVDGLLTVWYWNSVNQQWEWNGSTDGWVAGTINGDVQFRVQIIAFDFSAGVKELHATVDNFIGPIISQQSNRAMYVFDKEAQPKVFKSFDKKVRRPKIWR